MNPVQSLDSSRKSGVEKFLVRLGRFKCLEKGRYIRFGIEPRRASPRKQPRHEVRTIGRRFEQGLVEEVFQHVLAPNVDDEGHCRPERGDVGEILLGPDSDIDATRLYRFLEPGKDLRVVVFVRDEVFVLEGPAWLGQIGDKFSETLDRKSTRLNS